MLNTEIIMELLDSISTVKGMIKSNPQNKMHLKTLDNLRESLTSLKTPKSIWTINGKTTTNVELI